MNIFTTIRTGETATWADDAYEDNQGNLFSSPAFSLTYVFAGPIATPVTLTGATAPGGGWTTTLSASVSAGLIPGLYFFQAWVSNSSQKILVGEGEFTVEQNLSLLTGTYDGRSVAEKALLAAQAALSTFNSTNGRVKEYSIAGRHMVFQDSNSLLDEIAYWTAVVTSEATANSIKNGQGNPRRTFARFGPGAQDYPW
jgi:hypothetical protein